MFCHCPISFILPLTTNAILSSFPLNSIPNRASTVEPWYNEPLCNETLSMTNDFLYPGNGKICEKEPRYSEQILPVAWPFVISRFHCTKKGYHPLVSLPRLHLYNARPSEEYLCGATLEACEWGRERGAGAGELSFYLGRRQWHQSPTKWSEGAALTGKWTCYQTEETDRNASERTEWSHCKENKFGGRVKRRNDKIPVSWPSRRTLKF